MQPHSDFPRHDSKSRVDLRRSAAAPSISARVHQHRRFEHSVEDHRLGRTAGPEDPREGNTKATSATRCSERLWLCRRQQGIEPRRGRRHRPLPHDTAGGNKDAAGLELYLDLENARQGEQARLRTIDSQSGTLVGQQR